MPRKSKGAKVASKQKVSRSKTQKTSELPNKTRKSRKKTPKNAASDFAENIASEQKDASDSDPDAYFRPENYLKKKKSGKTSTATLQSVQFPTADEILALKDSVFTDEPNREHKTELTKYYQSQYKLWFLELRSGFNLAMYGVGSKKHILEEFVTQCCKDGPIIVVNGFFPELTIRQILSMLSETIFGRKTTLHRNSIMAAQKLSTVDRSQLKSKYRHFYLCINNIEGTSLRDKNSQTVLSILANCPYIHLIASFDHQNTMLLWDKSQLSRFHWVYHEISTFEHYIAECRAEFDNDPTITGADNERRARGIRHLLDSLTPVHYDVLCILAENAISNDSSESGMSYTEWFEECYGGMLVANDIKFRQLCGELKDHHVIQEFTADSGVVFYKIPYSNEVIQSEIIDRDLE